MATLIQKCPFRLMEKHTSAVRYLIPVCHYSDNPRIIKNPTTASLKRGTGGRSSFNGVVCTVFGSTGFLGRYVCQRLGKSGTQLILPFRGDPYDTQRLKLCGDLGQVLFHPYDLRDEDSIRKCIKYSNVVVNLVGRNYETKNFKYQDVNVDGARRLARLCKEMNVEHFIHVSDLNASAHPTPIFIKGGSRFLKSKYEGECAVREEFPEATIIRPSVVYGQEDKFLRHYTNILRLHIKGIPLWKMGKETQKQPIHVGDVAGGIVAAVLNRDTAGKVYQFVGPKRYTLHDLVEWIARLRYRNLMGDFRIMDIDWSPLFKVKVSLIENLSFAYPLGQIHWEGLESQHYTEKVLKGIPTLEDLGINPIEMDNQLPWELKPMRKDASYAERVGELEAATPPTPIPIH